MDAQEWDGRYASAELVWGARANRWVEAELADRPPGRALDLACGEGRNALWLASRGWHVTAVDFSAVALDKGRTLESAQDKAVPRVDWVCASALDYRPARPVDLALLCYLQVSADERRQAITHAATALAPGGVLLVIAHDSRNLREGTGGPQDRGVLYTAADASADLADSGLVIDRAEAVLRPVDGAPRPAIDALLRAHRPD